jgi:hypothetical protein
MLDPSRAGREPSHGVNMTITGRIVRFGLAIGLALGLCSSAAAVTSNTFTYSPVQQGSYMVTPLDFTPLSGGSTFYQNGGEYLGTPSSTLCFGAGVHLPQGARVLAVIVKYRNGAVYHPHFTLFRVAFASNAFNNLTYFQTTANSGDTAVYNGATAGFAVVDNTVYKYLFATCLGQDDRLYGARIIYQYTSAGD